MKRKLVVIFLIFFPLLTFAQIGGEDEVYLNGDRVEAKFNGGGIDKFSEFVRGQFNYSKVKKSGRMIASFTVDVDGSLKNIKLVEMIDVDSGVELIRVLNKCPKWEPAKRGGKPISIEIRYPMVFESKQDLQEPPKIAKVNSLPTNSEAPIKEPFDVSEEKIYNTAGIEVKPDFPGGIQEFYNYIGKKYRVPNVRGLAGKVFVSFVIEKDGSVTDIHVLRDIGHGTGAEAIRVLSKCPKWIPGEQQGKKVRVLYSLPINIQSP